MSRVTYTNTPTTDAQSALRLANAVRVVDGAEEGTGVNALPAGVYGFTYSPGLPNAPLFAVRRYRSYEIHKVPSGEVFVVGFADPEVVGRLESALTEITIQIHAEPDQGADALVVIPYSRIHQHRQYAAPNQHGFLVTLAPLLLRV